MKLSLIINKKRTLIKYFIISLLILLVIINELFLCIQNPILPLTLSSIFLFTIIGITNKKLSVLILSLLSIFILFLNGFNILNIIVIMESFYILILYNFNKKNLLLDILFFEVVIAVPLLLIITLNTNYITNIYTFFILLVTFLNRIFNTLISDICLEYIPFDRFIDIPANYTRRKTLSNLLTFTLLASILTPLISFIILTTINNQKQILEKATIDLTSCAESINEKIELWSDFEKSNLKLNNPIQVNKLIDILNVFSLSSNKGLTFYLIDFDNQVITNNSINNNMFSSIDWIKEGLLYKESHSLYKWIPFKHNTNMMLNYTPDSNFILETFINNTRILIAISASEYTSITISTYINIFKIILPLFLFLLIFIFILKKIILNSIGNLISITNDLPEKLKNNDSIVFDKTNITEIDSLIFNFQSMVDNLSKMIKNVETTNKMLIKSQKQLFRQANFDYLTTLPNRPFFIKRLEGTLKDFYTNECYLNKKGIAILFLDLDKFKQVNDSLGHQTGDKLLKIAASRMEYVIKSYNSDNIFLARLGGDEFVIKFIYTEKNDVNNLSEKISSTISSPFLIDNNKINISVSIGIALYPEDGIDINSLFAKSDSSMYKAKYSKKKNK